MSKLILENISKQYNGNWVLRNINFETQENEFAVFLGPSGCGKTTLLKIIAGLEIPDSGRIFLNGKEITNLSPAERKISMIFQNFPVYSHLNVFDNLAIPLRLQRFSKSTIKENVEAIADRLSLTSFLHRKTTTLSGGELQRVAIGKALIKQPKIFLMDEPLSDLDTQVKVLFKNIIRETHKAEQALFMYVTHDHYEANALADRVFIINNGAIMQCDSPEMIYKRPRNVFVAKFVGSPQINILKGKIDRKYENLYIKTKLGHMEISPDKDMTNRTKDNILVGIRPEHLMISHNCDGLLFATIKYCEFKGNQTIVWIEEVENFKIIADSSTKFEVGSKICLNYKPQNLIFFDNKNQKNLEEN